MQKSQGDLNLLLQEVAQAAWALLAITEELDLLGDVTAVGRRVCVALDELAALPETAWRGSGPVQVLDEIVDGDVVSELEERFFGAYDRLEGNELSVFLAQLLEKIERRYVALVEVLHKLNAALNA